MAANLSDIAAMGGVPLAVVVSLSAPPELEVGIVEDLYAGMRQIAARYDTAIVGGDTVSVDRWITLSLTVLGEVEKDKLLTRSGAQPGDAIVVTGTLGDAAAGLDVLAHGRGTMAPEIEGRLLTAHLRPEPRLREVRLLLKTLKPTACIDISDGLAGDLRHICVASGVGAEIELDKVPISVECHNIAALTDKPAMEYALRGGEDYELLFTIPRDGVALLPRLLEATTTKVIGQILEDATVFTGVDIEGHRTPLGRGYDHFLKAMQHEQNDRS
jgi:thiamine-monophosphate kinase